MADAQVDRTLGSYELIRLLKSGGFASVWLGRHVDSGDEFAIKILSSAKLSEPRVGDSPTIAERFIHEGELLQRLRIPGVVRVLEILDIQKPSRRLAYAMEYLRGRDLFDCLRHLDLPAFLELMAQAAEILNQVHKQDILHRDIKLSNVFICDPDGASSDRSVKLIDFGIAKDLANRGQLARTGRAQFLGTPSTLAPEVKRRFDDPSLPLTPKVDQFAFGVALYHGMSGQHPFGGWPEVLNRIDKPTPPLALRHVWSHYQPPRMLFDLVERCLARSPDDRHADMAEVAMWLRETSFELTGESNTGWFEPIIRGLPTSRDVNNAPPDVLRVGPSPKRPRDGSAGRAQPPPIPTDPDSVSIDIEVVDDGPPTIRDPKLMGIQKTERAPRPFQPNKPVQPTLPAHPNQPARPAQARPAAQPNERPAWLLPLLGLLMVVGAAVGWLIAQLL